MLLESWDGVARAEQEKIIGRTKIEGAGPGRAREHERVDISLMARRAHVRLAHPDAHGGARMLRRGYSYADGLDVHGRLDAGMIFLSYQADPGRSLVPVLRRLGADPRDEDMLNEYLRHEASGLWACPPGVRPGGFWGDTLLA